MSFQITEAFVQEFATGIYIQAQQRGSKLRPHVRQEKINGKSKAFDRIGSTEMVEKTSRHGNTPQLDTPHSKRWCYLKDWEWSDLIDDLDKVRVLNDPQSEYVLVAMAAAGRKMDDYILEAADMVVKTGEEADGTASLPNTQRFAANNGTAFTGMNVDLLRAVKRIFGRNEVDEDPNMELHCAITADQLYDMLGDEKITSSDYAAIKALVDGKVDTYMGFKFHKLQRVKKQTTALSASPTTGEVGSGSSVLGFRKVVFWSKPAIILGVGSDVKARITERDDKSYATQPYINMAIGSTRMEEVGVVIGLCKES